MIPLVPRAARTIELAIGERTEGAILHRRDGARLDRRTAHRWVRSIGKQAGLSAVYPPCSVRPSSWPHSMPAPPSETSRSPPAMRIPGRRRSMTAGGRTSIGTLPMSWLPSSPVGNRRESSVDLGGPGPQPHPSTVGRDQRHPTMTGDRAGNVFARPTGPFGGYPDVDQKRIERVPPEIIVLPPGGVIE